MFIKIQAKPKKRILGDVLRHAREELGLEREELANAMCFRHWQIQEIEEAETWRYFYTMEIKIQSSIKVGNFLGLSQDQYLVDIAEE